MSTRNAVRAALWVLVAGLAALVIGLSMSGARDDGRIICDGQVMGPGDMCFSTTPSKNGTYEELQREARESAESNAANGPVVAAIGGFVALVGAVLLLAQVPRHVANSGNAPASSDWWSEEGTR